MRKRQPGTNFKLITCLWLVATLLGSTAVAGEPATVEGTEVPDPPGDESDPVTLELYSLPFRKNLVTPAYPRAALDRNREGWVRLDFMVDPNGEPYEIAVTEWVGDPMFHNTAIRALEKSQFEPARFDGDPIDAGHYQYYHFELDTDGGSARPRFVRTYRPLMDAIGQGDREEADRLFDELEASGALNLYEDAYLHVAKSSYYANWGDQHQQLKALDRAVGHYTAEKRLPESLYVSLQRARFLLLVQTQDFGRAMEAFEKLTEYPLEEDVLASTQAIVDQLEVLRLDDRPYSVPGDFGGRFTWAYNLFKHEFFIAEVDGELAEIKLRCARKYVFLRSDPEMQYKIEEDYLPCRLQLVGDPGTTFSLTQL